MDANPHTAVNEAYPILIAEDNPDDAEILRHALRFSGARNPIHIVPDGDQAIQYLQGGAPYEDRVQYPFPKIIFTDLKMPRLTGFDVLDWLRKHPDCHVVPVIVFTSSHLEEDVRKAYQLGANCYLVKPLELTDMIELVRLTLRFWGLCSTPQPPFKCA